MIRHPNAFQATIVLGGTLAGGVLGATSRVDVGHSVWIMPLLGALGGAFVGLLISGAVLMVTNYWRGRRRDD